MTMSMPDPTSRSSAGLRCRQAGVTRAGLDRRIMDFEAHFKDVSPYDPFVRWWIARYSRGDGVAALDDAFAEVVGQVARDGAELRANFGDGALLFGYGPGSIGRFRDGLILLSIALCLRRPDSTRMVLRCCERGDPLIERLAQAVGVPRAERHAEPQFPEAFDGLYAALDAPTPAAAADALQLYLPLWCDERMDDMGFKIADEGIGYWCFEAAGVVAALGIDDRSFATEPVYPADLVAFYRQGG